MEELLNENVNSGEQSLDASTLNLKKGVYLVNITIEGKQSSKKLIVQ